MTPLLIAALLSQDASPSPATVPRTITFSVVDDKDQGVRTLGPDDLAVQENGVARPIERLELDPRPLALAVLLDSSVTMAPHYRLYLVDAVLQFLLRLPEGTKYALWTTGDRPTKIVDFTDERARAGTALKRTFPRGGNTVFDAIVEASDDLKQREGQRTAVVVVSGNGLGFSNYDRLQVVERALKNAHTFMTVNFQEGAAAGDPALGSNDDMGRVARGDYDFVLGALADRSGGLREMPLSAMAVGRSLDKIAGALGSQYRITYATLPDLKDRKIEVKVARPGIKVSLGASRS